MSRKPAGIGGSASRRRSASARRREGPDPELSRALAYEPPLDVWPLPDRAALGVEVGEATVGAVVADAFAAPVVAAVPVDAAAPVVAADGAAAEVVAAAAAWGICGRGVGAAVDDVAPAAALSEAVGAAAVVALVPGDVVAARAPIPATAIAAAIGPPRVRMASLRRSRSRSRLDEFVGDIAGLLLASPVGAFLSGRHCRPGVLSLRLRHVVLGARRS